MGCSQSKIENEEAVTRCKERKQYMKSSVTSRNAFAAGHSSYAMALKNTGAALSDFAEGEALHSLSSSSSFSTNPLLNTSSSTLPTSTSLPTEVPLSVPAPPTLPPAPPPPPIPDLHGGMGGTPLQRAVSMPEFKVPAASKAKRVEETIVEDEGDEEEEEEEEGELVRRERGRGGGSVGGRMERNAPPPPVPEVGGGWYDFFNVESVPTRLGDVEEGFEERPPPKRVFEEMPKRVERERVLVEEREERVKVNVPVPVPQQPVEMVVRKGKGVVGMGGGTGVGGVGGGEGGKKRSVDMVKVFNELDDHFLKAFESAGEVSKMLEAARLHYHSNFADDKGPRGEYKQLL